MTTPMEIVDKILEMGKVDREDVLYDLGSGDGRIVIRAAQKYGTRGIGYDLDPARIKESNEAAEKRVSPTWCSLFSRTSSTSI
ncbi:MAG TPA: hypothetical protein VGO90_15180 [Chthoniobacteraceae bacterium]|nr:hypothetical protein [Chthoniobacteraceae bacterium]